MKGQSVKPVSSGIQARCIGLHPRPLSRGRGEEQPSSSHVLGGGFRGRGRATGLAHHTQDID